MTSAPRVPQPGPVRNEVAASGSATVDPSDFNVSARIRMSESKRRKATTSRGTSQVTIMIVYGRLLSILDCIMKTVTSQGVSGAPKPKKRRILPGLKAAR